MPYLCYALCSALFAICAREYLTQPGTLHCAPGASWGAVAAVDGIPVIRSQMNSELAMHEDQLQQLCCQVLTCLCNCRTKL